MGEERGLETPQGSAELYLAFGADLGDFQSRPAFTGDVYRLSSDRLVALVQHPCAMRRGVALAPRLLVCAVKVNRNGTPPDWSSGHFKSMFLPDLDGESFVVDFDDADVVNSGELRASERIAILSNRGVNLLIQRWLFHNSRLVVPTITINAQASGPFNEADLIQEATADLLFAGKSEVEAEGLVDGWLGGPSGTIFHSMRDLLADPQQRSVVRSALRRQTKEWKK